MVWILTDYSDNNKFIACSFNREIIDKCINRLLELDKLCDVHYEYRLQRVENGDNGYPNYCEEEFFKS